MVNKSRTFIVFYENTEKKCISSYFVYGEDELRKDLKSYNTETENPTYKLLDVIELFDYKHIDEDEFM